MMLNAMHALRNLNDFFTSKNFRVTPFSTSDLGEPLPTDVLTMLPRDQADSC